MGVIKWDTRSLDCSPCGVARRVRLHILLLTGRYAGKKMFFGVPRIMRLLMFRVLRQWS